MILLSPAKQIITEIPDQVTTKENVIAQIVSKAESKIEQQRIYNNRQTDFKHAPLPARRAASRDYLRNLAGCPPRGDLRGAGGIGISILSRGLRYFFAIHELSHILFYSSPLWLHVRAE